MQRHVLYLGEINDSQELAWRKSIEAIEGRAPRARTLSLFPDDRCEELIDNGWCSTEAQGDAVVPAADIRELLAGLDAVAGIAAGPLREGPPARQPRGHALGRRPIFHQLEGRVEAHIFIAFLAYCLHVTLARRLGAFAPGLTPLEKFSAVQMIDVHIPTTDGREPRFANQKITLQTATIQLNPHS